MQKEDVALIIGAIAAALCGAGDFLTGNKEYGVLGLVFLAVGAALKAYLKPTPPPPPPTQ